METKKILARSCLFWFSLFFILGIGTVNSQNNFVRVNQIGYYANAPKIAILANMDAVDYEIRDVSTREVVFHGNVADGAHWRQSGEKLQVVDFSDFKKPGKYFIKSSTEQSYPFEIKDSALFDQLSVWSLKAFYLWRASTEIKPEYATFGKTVYSRALGHPDDVVYIHVSAATEKRHVESEVSAPKGWYDAGDYNKYVVNAGISFHSLALAYEMYPDYYKRLNLNIPESGNGVPDILNEMKWELDWLFNMQDEDGSVYTKLTTLKFSKMVMPAHDKADRYMVGKSTPAALNFAAMMAMASRIYAKYDSIFPGLSAKALTAAEKSWNWAVKHPKMEYTNPKDVRTGEYGDGEFSDEFFWAASELFITTKNVKYFNELQFYQKFDTPSWRFVNSLGIMSLALHKKELESLVDVSQIDNRFRSLSENIYKQYVYSPSRVPISKYEWGSNSVIAQNGTILGLAYFLTNETRYRDGMLSSFDYLLGTNPTDYCFVTRFGSHYPRNLHDRRSSACGIAEPMPGYLVGGANPENVADCGRRNYPSSQPARCYLDKDCSFSTNEIAINWNAPFALLVGMVENTFGKK
ncbi:MAG TPA: glycoside hydrolase family 9 protein [Paludibacteraceae bacterium]|jgi:endoglucanase|nr:glycoside hydrolase family 9 protein [Paludibacteraceae bacterium]HOU68204.1 glycoside hydrolase family 9 protein [Paludibacteraceae bacterium]HPH63736.1 glycoside hydrolase family 9 protein [Paludibacteraceae bacterium]HQF50082.1 glycoside hydrolase family 9 protein [Paludibacteraceae bacterium]HQJ89512.1 glycoside hydrolase family 9 protein [Paludibacteraceae bacterium]